MRTGKRGTKETKEGRSAEPVDELAWCEDVDARVARVSIACRSSIAGDDRVRVAGGRERDQVVVVGVAAHGWMEAPADR